MAIVVRPSTTLVQTEKSQQFFEWIAVKFCTGIHNSYMMYPNYFGDALAFPLAPP